MDIKLTILLLGVALCNISFSQDSIEIPTVNKGEQIVRHFAYTLSYNEEHEQARWVAYNLTSDELDAAVSRTDKFIEDQLVKTGSATDFDYKGSGYDRGHLAPAADMRFSKIAMVESFYYSNMSPQVKGFNRGIWFELEELVRCWAMEYKSIYVVTGPVLRPGLQKIGINGVSVAEYYYKVVLYNNDGVHYAIGFILPNKPSSLKLESYAVPVNEVESKTGIDFFPALNDEDEERVEGVVYKSMWKWNCKR